MRTNIEDMKNGGWYTVEVKVIQLWDNEHTSIRQVGLVGDDTGVVKFVSWNKSDLPMMEHNAEYEITNVAASEYEDRLQISLNVTSTIKRLGTVQSEIPTV